MGGAVRPAVGLSVFSSASSDKAENKELGLSVMGLSLIDLKEAREWEPELLTAVA